MAPAMMAEQQRARTEIEAALTIAAHRPRDQKECLDKILTSCQRPGLAAKAKYRYSRGGTDIEGVTIDLMECVAQLWGNIDFGFRELARFPGQGGGPGESIVEAYAWDLESNTKRKVQFTVQHAERTKKGMRIITDPRDIYEWIANQAQRRVRTCLENIIPRDIYETAGDECERTMRANVGDVKEAVLKLVPAFAQYGVTKEMLEARLQRRLETISAAQVVYLRSIWTGIRDGVSHPEDFFDLTIGEAKAEEKPQTATDKAKEAMRKQAPQKPATTQPPKQQPQVTSPKPAAPPAPEAQEKPAPVAAPPVSREPGDDDDQAPYDPEPENRTEPEPESQAPEAAGTAPSEADLIYQQYIDEAGRAENLTSLRALRKHAEENEVLKAHPDVLSRVQQSLAMAEEVIRRARGGRSSQ